VEALEFRSHLYPELGIEVRQWLVHQENLGVADEGPAQRYPLLLPTREFPGLSLEQ
jgi:hypothetical protein